MKVSERTLSFLKNFSTINQSILFRKGNVISTTTKERVLLAFANVAEEFPRDFGIYDFSKLIGILSLFESPDIKFEEHNLLISSGTQSSKYVYASPDMITYPKTLEVNVDKFDVKFKLLASDLSLLMKSAAMLQLTQIAIIGDGKKIVASTINVENPTGDEYTIDLSTKTKNTFRMVFDMVNMVLLGDDYEVQISAKGIANFQSKDLTYWIPVKMKNSSFGD